MPGPRENTVPSNYTPLPAHPRTVGTSPDRVRHDRLHAGTITGRLLMDLTTVDPVRVGSGVLLPVTPAGGRAELVHDLLTRRSIPVLPGSSLKGVVRQLVEVLGGGCDLSGPCSPPCVACSLFGFIGPSGAWRGRAGFDDALTGPKTPVTLLTLPRAFAPRRSIGRRAYGAAVPGVEASVKYLVVPRGQVFKTRLYVDNLLPAEMGLILTALGLDGTFHPRVGGGKFAGLGRVKVEVAQADVRESGYRGRPVALKGEALQAQLTRWRSAWTADEAANRALAVLRTTMGAR